MQKEIVTTCFWLGVSKQALHMPHLTEQIFICGLQYAACHLVAILSKGGIERRERMQPHLYPSSIITITIITTHKQQ